MPERVPANIKEAIRDVASKSNPGKPGLPELSDLAEHFIRLRGGAAKVAGMLSQEWDAAKAGSIARTRILDLLTRAWKFGNERNQRADDLGLLTEEDLAREMDGLLGTFNGEKAQESGPGVPADPRG